MKNCFLLILFLTLNAHTSIATAQARIDTTEIIKLNDLGYENRLVDPEQTWKYANKALLLSKKIGYLSGIAEAYRVRGIARFYQDNSDAAIENYTNALTYFIQAKNEPGKAKVYNNIGNVYRDIDYDKGLEHYAKSLQLAEKLDIKDLIAGLHLNMGIIYQKKKNYNSALKNYEISTQIFQQLNNTTGLTQCLQNIGVTYHRLGSYRKAEEYLLRAIEKARENDLNIIIASTNLTLASVYIAEDRFKEAEAVINEGINYSKIVNDSRLSFDYIYTSYELESKRKNFEKALHFLKIVYKNDSIKYKNNVSASLSLTLKQMAQQEELNRKQLTIEKQKNTQLLFIASTVVATLLLALTFVLVKNVRRKAKSNALLKELNQEIYLQKEHLNRVNLNLEEIIEERTKDLKIKNRKLSEYSSHLSHQIRGPIATLKGLMLLEKDDLIDQKELAAEINKCVTDIDNKIININQTLNDASIPGLEVEM